MLTPKRIAVIDPFMVSPALNCYNRLVESLPAKLQYHQPHLMGVTTLENAPADAYLVLGSASHVTQPLPWHQPLADFLFKELHQQKPVLGICFGHQLMCHRFGSQVEFYFADQQKFTGIRTVFLTKDVLSLRKGQSFTLSVSHRQVVTELSQDLEEIGHGLTNDIVRHKTLPFMGTQPHPEASAHFCAQTAQINDLKEVDIVQKDGLSLIRAFFDHYGITGTINL